MSHTRDNLINFYSNKIRYFNNSKNYIALHFDRCLHILFTFELFSTHQTFLSNHFIFDILWINLLDVLIFRLLKINCIKFL